MSRRVAVWLLSALVSFALLGACAGRRDALRYRVTLEVEAPAGLKIGSSVMENRHEAGARGSLRQFQAGKGDVIGEAVAVDLGNGNVLFAVLQDRDYRRRIYEMIFSMLIDPDLSPPLSGKPLRGDWSVYPEVRKTKPFAVIKRPDYPMLVTFDDLSDPKTVREVNPDYLAGSFGPGYSLRRITVQVTEDPLTKGIVESIIPWIKMQHGSLIKSTTYKTRSETPNAHDLNEGSFISAAI